MPRGDLPAGAFGVGTFAEAGGRSFPGLVLAPGDRVLDVSDSFESARMIFNEWDDVLPTLQGHAAERSAEARPYSELTPLPPVANPQVFQAGANFKRHVVDMIVGERYDGTANLSEEQVRAQASALMDERAKTGIPYVFSGLPSALTGATGSVVLPSRGERHDWELELAVVFSKNTRHVSERQALDHVAGYMIANDVTTRDLFFRDDVGSINVDFITSKQQPTFCPVGPYVLPARFIGNLDDVRITLSINGEIKQDETLDDMIFGVEKLIAYTSSIAEIRPGDILMCGSPAGNGAHWRQFLKPGDVMQGTITGLGLQRNDIVAGTA